MQKMFTLRIRRQSIIQADRSVYHSISTVVDHTFFYLQRHKYFFHKKKRERERERERELPVYKKFLQKV
jgi:hypothetical protein